MRIHARTLFLSTSLLILSTGALQAATPMGTDPTPRTPPSMAFGPMGTDPTPRTPPSMASGPMGTDPTPRTPPAVA